MKPAFTHKPFVKSLLALIVFAQAAVFAQPAIEWDKTYEPGPGFRPSTAYSTTDGGIIVGRSELSDASNYVISKYNAAGDKEWDKTFSGNKRDNLTAIIATTDGGYLLGGSSRSNDGQDKSDDAYSGKADFWIIKVTSNGTKQWDKTFGGTDVEELSSLKQTSDGGYILGGTSYSDSNGIKSENRKGGFDYWVVKIASDGIKQWDKTIGGAGNDYLVYVDQTASGNYILGGNSYSSISGDKTSSGSNGDYWIVQISQNGLKQWDKTIGGKENDLLISMKHTSDGGYLLGGNSTSAAGIDKSENGAGLNDFWVVKINANGDKQWDKTLGGGRDEDLKSVEQTADGGYIIGGDSKSGIGGNKTGVLKGNTDYWIVKLSSTGTVVWDNTIGAASNSYSNLVAALPSIDGGYLLCGNSLSVNAGNDKTEASNSVGLWVVKLVSESNTKKLAFSSGTLKYVNDGNTTTPTQSIGLSANTGTPFVTLKNSSANWLTLPVASLGSLPFVVNPSGLLPDKYISIVAATSPGYARALVRINLHVNDVTTPPTLNPIGYQEGAGVDTLTFIATATTAIGQTKRFSLIGAPQGATIGISTGVFKWIPPKTPGTYQFIVKVSIAAVPELSDEETITVKVLSPSNVTAVRINSGGGAFTTGDGRVFEADKYFEGVDRINSIADVDILNTTDDNLYRSTRCSDYFDYHIPVTNGIVKVTLHFTEIYWGVYPGRPAESGRRLFDVFAEETKKLSNYSIVAKAGGPLRAVQETFEVEVLDGDLNLAFRSTSENRDKPSVSAIEVEYIKSTETVTLSPLADSYISYGTNAGINYGNETTLNVKLTSVPELRRVSFLKFSLAGINDIASAKFHIYGYNQQSTNDVKIDLLGLDNDNWTEAGITADNAPTGVMSTLGSFRVSGNAEYFEIGITEFAKAQFGHDKTLTLMLVEPSDSKRIIFNSRENVINPPELIVTSAGPVNSAARLAGKEILSKVSDYEAQSSVIYPNPLSTQFTVEIGNQHQEEVSLRLFDKAGRVHSIKTSVLLHAGIKTNINIADLSLGEGIYLLKVQSASKSEMLKVMVIK